MKQQHIRNFAIIAHIDHGKSTLADRLLETTGTISKRDSMEQILDSNPIERERGITIKLAPVRMRYKIRNPRSEILNKFQTQNPNDQNNKSFEFRASNFEISNSEFILNLIDTPGHVDFSYEVSRSLAACEGVLLVVDATQGVQAQTLAHMQSVKKRNLVTIPIINKIDLVQAEVENTKKSLKEIFGFRDDEFISISAKTGENVNAVLEAIIAKIPPPSGNPEKQLRGLVFSSIYDHHRGVIVFVRIVDGKLETNPSPDFLLSFCASSATFHPVEIGYFTPKMQKTNVLKAGEVGYIATGFKDASLARIGDTVTIMQNANPLPGYQEPKSMVFMEVFPIDGQAYEGLRDALEKLNLSDSAFSFSPTSSKALGHGFHCGFLGLLHAEVVMERLLREFAMSAISTVPSVEYRVVLSNEKKISVQRAENLPDPSTIREIREPIMQITIYAPKKYIGNIMQLCEDKRGDLHDFTHLESQVKLTYTMPLSDMIVDFFDRLKGATEGYASLDYEFFSYEPVDAVKLSILINREEVDALATLVVRDKAHTIGRSVVERLKDVIPRQQFAIPIQAAIGGKIVARETVRPYRKDVTQKLYGGDRSRKDKLLKKQKKGKKRMKMVGRVEIPQEAFLAVLKR